MNTNSELFHIFREARKLLQFHKDIGIQVYPATDALQRTPATSPSVRKTSTDSVGKRFSRQDGPPAEGILPKKKVVPITEIEADIADCQRCSLHQRRTNLVFGSGSDTAQLMIIGNRPNEEEDKLGRLYEGAAGKLLVKMLGAMQLTPDEVYYTTLLKCRPPNLKGPLSEETNTCFPILLRQIEAITPKIIWALGTEAAQQLLKSKESILKLRGRFHDFRHIPIMATFHPDMMLHNEELKKPTWQDMQMIRKMLANTSGKN